MAERSVQLRVKLTGDKADLQKVIDDLRKQKIELGGLSVDSAALDSMVSDLEEAQSAAQALARDVDEVGGALRAMGSVGVDHMATAFDDSRKNLAGLVDTQQKALAAMKLTGRDGTAQYATLRDELAANTSELRDMDKVLESITASPKEVKPPSFGESRKELVDLVDTQQQALAAMKLTGRDGTAQYAKLRDELEASTAELRDMDQALAEVNGTAKKTTSFMEKAFQFEALGAAGEKINEFVASGVDYDQALRTAAARNPNAGAAELEELGRLGGEAYASGYGESVGEAILGAADVRKHLGDILPTDQLDEATLKAMAFAKAWDEDLNDTVAKSTPLFKAFNLETAEGFDLVAYAKANLANGDDDALDTIKEYSGQFAQMGFSAEETLGILERGLDAGAFNTDKIADGVKEAFLRITSVGDEATKALDEVSAAPAALIDGLKAAIADARSGDLSIADALAVTAEDIKAAYDSGQISDTIKKQLEIAIGNTPLEDIGTGVYTDLFSSPIPTDRIQAQATLAGQKLQESMAPANLWESITRGGEAAFASVAGAVGPIIGPLGGALTTLGSFGPALTLLNDQFSIFDTAGDLIKGKLVPSILSMIPGLGAQTAATGAATAAQAGLNATMLLNPAFLLVAGIAAVVGAFLIFGESTQDVIDGVKESTEQAKSAMEAATGAVSDTAGVDKQQKSINALADEYDRLRGSSDPADQARFKVVAEELAQVMPQAAESVKQFNEAGEEIGETYKINTDVVRGYTSAQLAQNAALRDGAVADVQKKMRDLAESTGDARDELGDLKAKQEEYQKAVAEGVDLVDTGFFSGWEDSRDALDEVTIKIRDIEVAQGDANAVHRDGVKFLTEQGHSAEQIAASTDLTVQEVKKFQKELGIGEKSAKGTAKATGDIKDAAAGAASATDRMAKSATRAKANAEQLAAAYDKVRSAADSGADNAFKGVLQLRQQQRETERNIALKQKELASITGVGILDIGIRNRLQGEIGALRGLLVDLRQMEQDELQAAKDAFAEIKQLETQELILSIQLGLTDVNVDDYTEQAKQIRRATASILFGVANASIEDELTQAKAEIDQDLKESLADIDDQIKALDDKRKEASLTNKIVGIDEAQRALRDQKDALAQKAEQDKAQVEKELREKRLEELKKLLGEEQEVLDLAADQQIARLNREITALAGDDSDEALKAQLEKRRAILDLEMNKELAAVRNSNEEYLELYAQEQGLRRQAVEAATEAEKVALNAQADALKVTREEKGEAVLETDIRAQIIREKFAQEGADAEAAITDKHYDRELKKLEKKHAREEALLARRLERQREYFEAFLAFTESIADSSTTARAEVEMQELDRLRDEELISLGRYEAEKTRIQEEAEKARMLSEARTAGLRMGLEDEELQQKKLHLEERIKLAEESGKIDEAGELGEELAAITAQIEEKGEVLQQSLEILKEGAQDSLRGLFAQDEDAVKDPMKKVLATMIGYIQNLVSAKIVELVINSIPAGAGFLGAIAGFALRPAIEAAFSSLLGPLLANLASFATGGRVDSPTLAIVGDAARLGGSNREWIFNDDQLREVMSEVLRAQAALISAGFNRLESAIERLSGRFHVSARDVYEGGARHRARVRRRVVYSAGG